MKIYLGSDHGGFHLKEQLEQYLLRAGYDVEDDGPQQLDPDDDYPDFAATVATKVLTSGSDDPRGILICRGAQGMGIAANRFKGIRASVVWNTEEAQMTRNDNDSNVLCLSATQLDEHEDEAYRIVDTWLRTEFSKAPRHARRIKQLDELS